MDGTNRQENIGTRAVNDTDWKIGGVGDFDGDGQSDNIVWRHQTTGENTIWQMQYVISSRT